MIKHLLQRADEAELEFQDLLKRFDDCLSAADLDEACEVLIALEANVEKQRSERKMHILYITQKRFSKAEVADR